MCLGLFYNDLLVRRGTGGVNDYFEAASLGAINLDGSQVFGWSTIDVKRDDFIAAHPGRWDKIKGAIDAFSDVDTSRFAAVVAIFNVSLGDGGAQGGVLCGPDDTNVTFLAHEIGHVFGLEHSFDQSARTLISWSAPGEYYDEHDIMSAMNVHGDAGHRFSPRGPLLNAANLERMDCLPANRVWLSPSKNSSGVYDVDATARNRCTSSARATRWLRWSTARWCACRSRTRGSSRWSKHSPTLWRRHRPGWQTTFDSMRARRLADLACSRTRGGPTGGARLQSARP